MLEMMAKSSKKPKDRRVTVRLDPECWEKLRNTCEASDIDASFVIRQALEKYFTFPDHGPAQAGADLVMPAEAFRLEGPYRAWPGDLRVELRKRFLQLLALAHVTSMNWSKTSGVREVYYGLLALGKYLGIGNAV